MGMGKKPQHRKHAKTRKAGFGHFGRLEIAILGTPCSEIKKLAYELTGQLADFNIAYVDADHKTEESEMSEVLRQGAALQFTDKIAFRRFDYSKDLSRYQKNALFNQYDLVIVNGNHFEADHQIVVIDDRKPLDKKLDRISSPLMAIVDEENSELPEMIKERFTDCASWPIIPMKAKGKIAGLIRDFILLNTPRLFGLVLAGGMSQRMGMDKGLIVYHGRPQREYLYEMVSKHTEKTYMSCRQDQVSDLKEHFEVLPDTVEGLGPFGALFSAFREYPDAAWLVAACDLPLLDHDVLSDLSNRRNASKMATAFHNPETGFPEPLITIWEPKAYPVLLHFLSLGYSCPRKVLINSDIEILQTSKPEALKNVNSPTEYERMLQQIRNG
jgi:molybdopterin-guanine dinucleotide biosynthesis protein A